MRKRITKENKKPIQQKAKSALNPQEKDIQHLQFNKNPPARLQQAMLVLHQAVGNRAVVQQLAQVQKRGAAADTSNIHNIAAAGVQGMGSRLPHYNRIQTAFGKHSIAHVQAYTGKQAATASHAMGAKAYTTGNKVAFADSNPDVHTTAHETAHVFQQEAGVRLKDNVGKAGDQYEREADVIANSVVQGKSVESQLSRMNHKPHQKNQSMTMRKPVQRLMGVEAELTVPVWLEPANGAKATDDEIIRGFFSGGFAERTLLANPSKGFKIVSDHDELGRLINNFRAPINNALLKAGSPQIPPTKGGHNVANMEYVTAKPAKKTQAYNEEDPNELKAFRQSIKDMAADMTTRVNNAKAGINTTPLAGYRYGIPPLTTFQNFAKTNNINFQDMAPVRKSFIDRITDNLYVQINAGILPRGISKYLNKLSKDEQLASLKGNVENNDRAWIKLLTVDAAAVAERALNNTPGLAKKIRRDKSLRGLVALIVSTVFGLYSDYRRYQAVMANANFQRPLSKNRIPVLPKTPLTNVLRELDISVRPDLWKAADRDNLKDSIINHIIAKLDLPPVDRTAGGKTAGTDQGANVMAYVKGGFTWKNWVNDILTNTGDSIFNNLGGITQVDPHDHPRSNIIDPGKDHLRTFVQPVKKGGLFGIGAQAGGTKAKSGVVVTELRFVGKRPQPNELLSLVDRAVKKVKESNK